MPERLDDLLLRQKPTAERPLAGHTVLVVEDSRFASEALRLMCLRSGARVRRADSVMSAARHLATYRPSIALVDLGLPDGSGIDVIAELTEIEPPVSVILSVSGDPALEAAASDAGAHGFLAKPVSSVAAFQTAILSRLPPEDRPAEVRPATEQSVAPDRIALRDDLLHLRSVLDGPSATVRIAYAAQFLASVACTAGDAELDAAARELADASAPGTDIRAVIARVCALLDSLTGDTAQIV